MFLARWALLWALISCATAQLFGGADYVGSPEQLAELERITADAQAKRAKYAAELFDKASQPAFSAQTAPANKNAQISQASLDKANLIVDAAISRWTDS